MQAATTPSMQKVFPKCPQAKGTKQGAGIRGAFTTMEAQVLPLRIHKFQPWYLASASGERELISPSVQPIGVLEMPRPHCSLKVRSLGSEY